MCRSGAMKRLNVLLSARPACGLKNFNWPASYASMSIASILPRNRRASALTCTRKLEREATHVARPQPHHFTGPQPATIGECQHRSRLQARRHGQDTLDLLRAQHRRQLLRLLEVPHLGRQIVATQRDAEQEPYPRHDPIAVADARTALDEMQLETPHLVRRCRVRRALKPGGEPLAA